jgi:hypothetical protein
MDSKRAAAMIPAAKPRDGINRGYRRDQAKLFSQITARKDAKQRPSLFQPPQAGKKFEFRKRRSEIRS